MAKVLDIFLKDEVLTADEVVSASGLSMKTVRGALARLKKEKLIQVADQKGRAVAYSLSDSERAQKLKSFAFRDGVDRIN